ncbi:hypothetical protein ACFLV0_01095 [Chloroflexota bacterium]
MANQNRFSRQQRMRERADALFIIYQSMGGGGTLPREAIRIVRCGRGKNQRKAT